MLIFPNYPTPLGKWCDPSFGKYWISITQEWFALSLIDIGPVVQVTIFFSPWKMAWCFLFNKLESPLHMQLFRKRFWNVVNVFLHLSPFGKWRGPSFEQTWINHHGCFVPCFATVEIGSVVLEKNICKCWLFSLFCGEYFPLEKIMSLSSDKLESSTTNDVCAKIS